MSRVLIIDDEVKITRLLSERIGGEGYDVDTFGSAEEALPAIREGKADIVLCDLRLSGMDGLELLRQSKKTAPEVDFVIMTAYASASTAVEAMRQGAYEYLIKPFQMDEVILLLKRIQERRDLMAENLALREKVSAADGSIIGESEAIEHVIEMIGKVAPTDTPVLIQGESGTGKELVASAIHNSSGRRGRPFIVINCAAVPETLLEAELFGYEKGAFTGATQKKPGQFKLADTGTLFLDEIGDMPTGLQAKLLRAIENGEILPLGGSRPVKVDVRIIAASNRDLEELTAGGTFREDLLYRLNVFPIKIPPLRQRKSDILPIAESFLASRAPAGKTLSEEVVDKLMKYSWPGNVRELRNILERAVILSGEGRIEPEHITISRPAGEDGSPGTLDDLVGRSTLPQIERKLIEMAIEKAGGNKSRAARILGITRRTLYGRLERYGMDADGPEEED